MQRYVEQNQQLFLSKGKTDKEMWEELEAINNARYILSRLPQVVNCPDCGRMYDTDYLHFCCNSAICMFAKLHPSTFKYSYKSIRAFGRILNKNQTQHVKI